MCEYRGLGQIFDMPEMWLHLLSNMPPGHTDSACDSSGPLPGLNVQLCLHAGHDRGWQVEVSGPLHQLHPV